MKDKKLNANLSTVDLSTMMLSMEFFPVAKRRGDNVNPKRVATESGKAKESKE